jgi:predicted RNA binding protein YcfA (HicA-like mRNA interferase family)
MGFTITAAELKKYLTAKGFRAIGQRGSHLKMHKGNETAIVPMHKGDLPPGTLRGIISDAGLTIDDLKKWAGKE